MNSLKNSFNTDHHIIKKTHESKKDMITIKHEEIIDIKKNTTTTILYYKDGKINTHEIIPPECFNCKKRCNINTEWFFHMDCAYCSRNCRYTKVQI